MNCIICRQGQTALGHANVTLQRGVCTVIISAVLARAEAAVEKEVEILRCAA